MRYSFQQSFNPVKFGFSWTSDWYEWDHKTAHKEALKARNAAAKKFKAEGFRVVKGCMGNQLITRGGIGSEHPEISLVVSVYTLDIYKD